MLSLNSSLDKIYTTDKLIYGGVVRANKVSNTAGGKGIHVADIITIMGEKCILTGFLGGKTGEFIRNKLNDRNIRHEFVDVNSETRMCVNIMTPDGKQTEVLEQGPFITEKEQQIFLEKYKLLLKNADIIVASGSLPTNINNNFYETLIQIANNKGKMFLLDTSGITLKNGIAARPYSIKPNLAEMECYAQCKIKNIKDAVTIIQLLGEKITMPIISLGKEGAIVKYKGIIYHVMPPKLSVVNAVGSGDAFMAGLAIGLTRKYDTQNVIKLACACWAANVIQAESGYIAKDDVKAILENVIVERL